MKTYSVAALALAALLLSLPLASAEDTNTAAGDLKALVSKVQDKLRDGKRSEAELAPELKEFDTLLEKHKGEKADDTAQILLMKAMLYLEVLDNSEKGTQLVQQLKQDYPDTKTGKAADGILENIKLQEASKKIQRSLVEGSKFPDFDEKDVDGKPLSIAGYKGKVVLLDFWATWCGPCVMELPNVLKTYEKHHDQGFEIIGVSLDQEEERLRNFLKQKNVTWR